MSSNTPFGAPDGAGHSAAGGLEYLGHGAPVGDDPARPRKWSVIGATTVGVLGVVAVGGWGAYALLSGGGAQPTEALPADTVAYVSLDLDPSASQKIEAFKLFRKFPGLQKELGLESGDDIRRLVFEAMQEDGDCTKLDYGNDIEPWIGQRVALAVVPGDEPGAAAPVVALQVTDQKAATVGVRALADCGGAAADGYGFAFSGDYLLLTDSAKHAEAVAADAAEGSLADDAGFQEWTEKVGDPGIITAYAAPGAPGYLVDLQDELEGGSMVAGDSSGDLLAEDDPDRVNEQVNELYKDFQGMAMTVRFDDGAVEAEFAGAGMPDGLAQGLETGPGMADLPASTAAAFSVGLSEGWLDTYLESMSALDDMPVEDLMAEAEQETGLDLPEDVETLLGDGFSFSVDGSIDFDKLMRSPDFTELPVGLRVAGDPDEILPVVDKIRALLGPDSDMLIAEPGDGVVAFGISPDYVDTLLQGGSLGEQDRFRNVLPEADRQTGGFYLDFDAGDGWSERLAGALDDMTDEFAEEPADAKPEDGDGARENVAPLDALGFSSWVEGDEVRGLFRLTTD